MHVTSEHSELPAFGAVGEVWLNFGGGHKPIRTKSPLPVALVLILYKFLKLQGQPLEREGAEQVILGKGVRVVSPVHPRQLKILKISLKMRQLRVEPEHGTAGQRNTGAAKALTSQHLKFSQWEDRQVGRHGQPVQKMEEDIQDLPDASRAGAGKPIKHHHGGWLRLWIAYGCAVRAVMVHKRKSVWLYGFHKGE